MSLVTGGVSYHDAVRMTRLERHAAIQVLSEFNEDAERRIEQARHGATSTPASPRALTQSSGAPPTLATWRP